MKYSSVFEYLRIFAKYFYVFDYGGFTWQD